MGDAGALGLQAFATDGADAVRVEAAGQIVANRGAGLIANNAGSLTGHALGPTAGVISNNVARLVGNHAAGLIANNAAGLIANNSAGIISNNVGRYGLLDLATLTAPAAGAQVEAVDGAGRTVSLEPAMTDAEGRFTLQGLRPSGPAVFVRATYAVAGQVVTLMGAAAAPRAPGAVEVVADPATTLVAKKIVTLVARGVLPETGLDVGVADRLAAAIGPRMSEVAVAAAAVQPADAAAGTFDAMVQASAALKADVADAAPGPAAVFTADRTSGGGAATGPVPGVVGSLAGGPAIGYKDGPGADARFNYPYGIAAAPDGTVYVADSANHCIRRFRLDDPARRVDTLAGAVLPGHADGGGGAARFRSPRAIALDPTAPVPTLFVADTGNQRIRRLTIGADGIAEVTTLAGDGEPGHADGAGAAARFKNPRGVAVDEAGTVYVADTENYCVRAIAADGAVTTIAGFTEAGGADGPLAAARFAGPYSLAFDAQGRLLVADPLNNAIRRIDLGPGGGVTTLAGGAGSVALDLPAAVAASPDGRVWAVDFRRNRVVAIGPDGAVTTIAGGEGVGHVDGPAEAARFSGPYGLAWRAGGLIVADTSNQRIRLIGLAGP